MRCLTSDRSSNHGTEQTRLLEDALGFVGAVVGAAEPDENVAVAAVPPLHTAKNSSRHLFAARF